MKIFQFCCVFSLILIIVASGCDSPSDSKSTTVTAPTLVTPADQDTMVSVTPTFTWTGSADKLDVGSNNTFTTIIHSADVSGTSYVMPSGILHPGTFYYWRAGSTSGGTVYWSANIFAFRTAP